MIELDPQERTKIKKKAQLTRKLGVPKEVLPPSTLGVAIILGLVNSGKVVYGTDKHSLSTRALWTYGTTDFANPTEAIMLSQATTTQDKTRNLYITDPNAHHVRSYLERVLGPTVAVFSSSGTENNHGQVPETHDLDLDAFLKYASNPSLEKYLEGISQKIGQRQTFSGTYLAMNNALATDLNITHIHAQDFFRELNITVGDVLAEAKRIEEAVKDTDQSLRIKVAETARQAVVDLGYDQKTINVISQELVDEFYRFVLGGSELWNASNRKIFRMSVNGEVAIDALTLDPNLKLHQLIDRNITLGGNAWVTVMQMLEKIYNQDIIIAHKNTRAGANYMLPLLATSRTQAYISPIVRVTPQGQDALGGDGLDIGAYILNPTLTQTVQRAFQYPSPELIGGKKKITIEVGSQGSVSYIEPALGNGLDNKARKIVNI